MSQDALQYLHSVDRRLGALIDRVGPFHLRVRSSSSAFAALGEAIVYQQLTGAAAATILGRVKALAGGPRRFPTPAQILAMPDEVLRSAGLSRAKTMSLKDLSRKVADGVVPTAAVLRRLDDEHVVQQLTEVRGVGRWTAQMFLIFRLGRLDVLPAEDYGVRKGFAVVFRTRELPTPAQVIARGARWQPYRTVAAWYLWRALELEQTGRAVD
jgi:3-methyladenine DNA glycosylase/8-oxoguanine DNA glycosylase